MMVYEGICGLTDSWTGDKTEAKSDEEKQREVGNLPGFNGA